MISNSLDIEQEISQTAVSNLTYNGSVQRNLLSLHFLSTKGHEHKYSHLSAIQNYQLI